VAHEYKYSSLVLEAVESDYVSLVSHFGGCKLVTVQVPLPRLADSVWSQGRKRSVESILRHVCLLFSFSLTLRTSIDDWSKVRLVD